LNSSRLEFGIPGRQRGCRHLGVRQLEDNSDGNRALRQMQVEIAETSNPSDRMTNDGEGVIEHAI
jgi:hypothetical protein